MTPWIVLVALQEPSLGAQFHKLIEDCLVPMYGGMTGGEPPATSWLSQQIKADHELGACLRDFATDVFAQVFAAIRTAGDTEEVR